MILNKEKDQQAKKKKRCKIVQKRPERQMFWYKPRNNFFEKYCHESTHILNVFEYFVFCNKAHFFLMFSVYILFKVLLFVVTYLLWQNCPVTK